MKRRLALSLSLIMLICIIAGCAGSTTTVSSGTTKATTTAAATTATTAATTANKLNPNINMKSLWPITNEVVRPTLAFRSSLTLTEPKDVYLFQILKKKFNLDFNVTPIPGTAWAERFSLMVNTGDIPDVILNGTISNQDIQKYFVEGGLGYDMTADIAKYAPDLAMAFSKMPDMKAAASFDGKIVALPAYVGEYGTITERNWVRGDWLKTLNLAKPTTLAEFKDMLIAFRDRDPNGNNKKDEIPWSGSWNEGYSEREMIISSLGFVGSGANDKLNYNTSPATYSYFPLTNEYKEYLKFMSECWAEKLMDPDLFTQTNVAFLAKVSENNVGVASDAAQYTLLPKDKPAKETDYIYKYLHPMSAKAGGKSYYRLATPFATGQFVISAKSKFADVLVRFANITYAWPTIGHIGYYGTPYGSEFDILENHRGAYNNYDPVTVTVSYPEQKSSFPDKTTWQYQVNYCGATIVQWGFARAELPDYMKKLLPNPDISGGLWAYYCAPRSTTSTDWTYEIYPIMNEHGVSNMPNLKLSSKNSARAAELFTPLEDYVKSMEAKIITGAEPLSSYDKMVKELKAMGAEEYQKLMSDAYAGFLASMK